MSGGGSQQIAVGNYIAQATDGSTAISAQQLILVLGAELSAAARADLLRYLQAAVPDLSRTVIVDQSGNLIGEGSRYVLVEDQAVKAALAAVAREGPAVPLQLPLDVVDFTNRDSELTALDQIVCDSPGTACLHGMGGVGKSAVATHFAHTRQQVFPDGVLWADLRHQDTATVLDMFAFSYGADLSTITDLRAKTNVVRALLTPKRALVVLDNAEHASQLDLLLGLTGQISIVITTRRPDAQALRGIPQVLVGTFTEHIALDYFGRVLGHELPADQQANAVRLAERLGYLPLALDIGIRLTSRAGMDLRAFTDLLDQYSPGTLLIDQDRSLRGCFQISWDNLAQQSRNTLFSMTILEAPSFDVPALAAMNEQGAGLIQLTMGELVAGSLVIATQSGRYLLHPLVRDFAAAQSFADRDSLARAMGERAVRYYLSVAEAEAAMPETDPNRWTSTRRELENELATWRWASANGQTSSVMRLALSLGPCLFQRGYWDSCRELLNQGVGAAVALDSRQDELSLRLLRASLAREQGAYAQAEQDLSICMAADDDSADQLFRARAIRELGELRRVQRDYREALRLHRLSLSMSTSADDLPGQARSLHDCGLVERILGDFASAQVLLRSSINVSHRIRASIQEAYSKLELGIAARTTGNADDARVLLSDALEFFISTYDLRGQAYAQRELGELAVQLGSYDEAVDHHSESLRLRCLLGDRRGEAISSYYLAYAKQCLGQVSEARALYEASLALSRELGDDRNIARLLLRIGELKADDGDLAGALECWIESVALFDRLGVAENEVMIARKHLLEASPGQR